MYPIFWFFFTLAKSTFTHKIVIIKILNTFTASSKQDVIFFLLFFSEDKVLTPPSFTKFNHVRQDINSFSHLFVCSKNQ